MVEKHRHYKSGPMSFLKSGVVMHGDGCKLTKAMIFFKAQAKLIAQAKSKMIILQHWIDDEQKH